MKFKVGEIVKFNPIMRKWVGKSINSLMIVKIIDENKIFLNEIINDIEVPFEGTKLLQDNYSEYYFDSEELIELSIADIAKHRIKNEI